MEEGRCAVRGGRAARAEGLSALLSHILIVLAVIGFLFRKPLGRMFARQFPDRQKRHRVVGTIILAFALVIAVRLVALFWK